MFLLPGVEKAMPSRMPETKVCAKCSAEKSINDFGVRKSMPDGRRSECKKCYRAYLDNYRARHQQKINANNRRYYAALREEVFAHYGKQCACCSEDVMEFLSIDHINGGGRAHRKQTNEHIYEWLKKNGFPSGFRTLCHNCNFARGRYGVCPHEKARG